MKKTTYGDYPYLTLKIITACAIVFFTTLANAAEFYTPERLAQITANQSKHKALFTEINMPHSDGIKTFGGFKLNKGTLSSVLVQLASNSNFSSLEKISISGVMDELTPDSIKGLDTEKKALKFLSEKIRAYSYSDMAAKIPELGAGLNDTYILNKDIFIHASPVFIKGIPCKLMFILSAVPVKLLDASSKPIVTQAYKYRHSKKDSPLKTMLISTRLDTIKIAASEHELVKSNGAEFLAALNKKYMKITGKESKDYFTDSYGRTLSIEDNTNYDTFTIVYSTDKDYYDIQQQVFQEYHQNQAKNKPDSTSMF